MVRDLVDAVVGDVGDPDPGFGRGRHVDDVVADAGADEQARRAQPLDLGRPDLHDADDDRRCIGRQVGRLRGCRALGQDLHVDVGRAEELDARREKLAGVGDDDPAGECGHGRSALLVEPPVHAPLTRPDGTS